VSDSGEFLGEERDEWRCVLRHRYLLARQIYNIFAMLGMMGLVPEFAYF
jgi:hypothetical protein